MDRTTDKIIADVTSGKLTANQAAEEVMNWSDEFHGFDPRGKDQAAAYWAVSDLLPPKTRTKYIMDDFDSGSGYPGGGCDDESA